MTYLQQLEKILEMKYRLIAMETDDPDRVIDLFSELSRFSNKAFYLNQAEQGLHRIGAAHISIPHTQTATEMLEHIESVPHFGTYILRDFNQPLQQASIIASMKKIIAGNTEKVVILLGEKITLPDDLRPHAVFSRHKVKQAS